MLHVLSFEEHIEILEALESSSIIIESLDGILNEADLKPAKKKALRAKLAKAKESLRKLREAKKKARAKKNKEKVAQIQDKIAQVTAAKDKIM